MLSFLSPWVVRWITHDKVRDGRKAVPFPGWHALIAWLDAALPLSLCLIDISSYERNFLKLVKSLLL